MLPCPVDLLVIARDGDELGEHGPLRPGLHAQALREEACLVAGQIEGRAVRISGGRLGEVRVPDATGDRVDDLAVVVSRRPATATGHQALDGALRAADAADAPDMQPLP